MSALETIDIKKSNSRKSNNSIRTEQIKTNQYVIEYRKRELNNDDILENDEVTRTPLEVLKNTKSNQDHVYCCSDMQFIPKKLLVDKIAIFLKEHPQQPDLQYLEKYVTSAGCALVSQASFRIFIDLCIGILRLVYISRAKYGNQFDAYIIVAIGCLDVSKLQINPFDLRCIDFPGGLQRGFPATLYEYLEVMKLLANQHELDNQANKNKTKKTKNSESSNRSMSNSIISNSKTSKIQEYDLHERYAQFLQDYQPWARVLQTFVNEHGAKLPEIQNPSRTYGSFIQNPTWESFYDDIQTEFGKTDVPDRIMRFVWNATMASYKKDDGNHKTVTRSRSITLGDERSYMRRDLSNKKKAKKITTKKSKSTKRR
jgi:hypothetical protein